MREKERDKKDYQANNAAKKERKKENTTTTNNKFLRLLVNRIACLVILSRKSTDSETCNFSRCGWSECFVGIKTLEKAGEGRRN